MKILVVWFGLIFVFTQPVQIYDTSGRSLGNGDAADDDDAYDDDDTYTREEGGQYNQYADSDPLDILAFSEACSIELYGSACPDPFGIKKGYESTLRRATTKRYSAYGGHGKQAMQIASIVLLSLSAVIFVAAFIVRNRSSKRSIRFSEGSISDKVDALIASTSFEKQRSLIHSASMKARRLKEKFQEFAEEETDDDTLPSKEHSYVAPSESAGLDPSESVIASVPVESSTSTKKKKKRKHPWLNKVSKTIFGKKDASLQ